MCVFYIPSLKAKKLEKLAQEKVLLVPCSRFANGIRGYSASAAWLDGIGGIAACPVVSRCTLRRQVVLDADTTSASGHPVRLRATHCLPDAFGRQRQRRQTHPNRPGNGVGNSGRRGHEAALPNALRPVWPWPVSVLYQDAPQVTREVFDSGDAVIE